MNNPPATPEHAPIPRPNVPAPAGDPPELPVNAPSDFPTPTLTTGTVDDHDAPAVERASGNEAMVRETNDSTEAPEEFEGDNEVAAV
jgi:hypothetical protein